MPYSPARKSEEYLLPFDSAQTPVGLFRSPFTLSHRTRDPHSIAFGGGGVEHQGWEWPGLFSCFARFLI
jgi:hypothetical protein